MRPCLARSLSVAAVIATAAPALARGAPGARPAAILPRPAGKQPLVGWHAPAVAPVARDPQGRPMLTLRTVNRGESLAMPVLDDQGRLAARDLDRTAHLLRAASGDEHPIDPRTLALAYRIQTHFEVPELRVISAYRVPRPGSHSNHAKGRALDLVVPGVADEEVARFVRALGFVGVGVYPTSQFVHVDVRPRSYFWIDFSAPHRRNREHAIFAGLATKSDADALARGQTPIEPFVVGTDVDAVLRARQAPAGPPATAETEDEE